MAKNIAKKRKVTQVKTRSFRTLETKEAAPKTKAPYILGFLATFFLLVNGLTVIILRKELSALFGFAGFTVEASKLLTFGVIWIVLGIITWVTLHQIEAKHSRSEMWFMFIIGLICMLLGRLEAGILTTIAAVLYLSKYK
ncbi:hypothetical protein HZA33_02790 [Candidatus Pacearchaeota archaeon]|nr:hypothetical protein [Candidatus Pacearchaeota archaeon]